MLKIKALDHLVLTVTDIDRTCDFYHRVLGFQIVTFGAGRKAMRFGAQKINLHQAGREFSPKARHPTPGSADLCLLTSLDMETVVARLAAADVPIEEGPVARTGAEGPITSVYIRDPDHNLIEIARYDR